MAELAAEDADLIEPGEGATRICGADAEILGRRRQGGKSCTGVQVDDKFKPVAGSEFDSRRRTGAAGMGFVHPVHEGLLKTSRRPRPRGNVRANPDYQPRCPSVSRRRHAPRASLVVWRSAKAGSARGDRCVFDGDDDCRGERIAYVGGLRRRQLDFILATSLSRSLPS